MKVHHLCRGHIIKDRENSCICEENILNKYKPVIYYNTSTYTIYSLESYEVTETMRASYKKLWKVLIDKDMKKKDLQADAGISWASVTKLSKGENVSMEVLMKICKALECNIGDIMDLVSDEDTDE